ncbi:hypothetical protein GCM10011487_08050 [Steroidobacter agaridevorans]|uniref:Uncharacterized protein n=1 Tax=Steroidobacter agaridevorans TaxID=2695856 RepID=A0A829Y724_9GAMM|nr:hypothetical protein GCM10011487_08050 [Steroidobacter agaridevorans]GFE89261.1 hypothetical protein GCM10011488_42150 [Steroidobacter agaridevorans]
MAASTASLRSGLTFAVPLMMRDTVAIDTPASFATISSVGGESGKAVVARFLALLSARLLIVVQ